MSVICSYGKLRQVSSRQCERTFGETKMLIIAGILFAIAMVVLLVDYLFDSADIDLAWPVRILLTASAALILLDTIM